MKKISSRKKALIAAGIIMFNTNGCTQTQTYENNGNNNSSYIEQTMDLDELISFLNENFLVKNEFIRNELEKRGINEPVNSENIEQVANVLNEYIELIKIQKDKAFITEKGKLGTANSEAIFSIDSVQISKDNSQKGELLLSITYANGKTITTHLSKQEYEEIKKVAREKGIDGVFDAINEGKIVVKEFKDNVR